MKCNRIFFYFNKTYFSLDEACGRRWKTFLAVFEKWNSSWDKTIPENTCTICQMSTRKHLLHAASGFEKLLQILKVGISCWIKIKTIAMEVDWSFDISDCSSLVRIQILYTSFPGPLSFSRHQKFSTVTPIY